MRQGASFCPGILHPVPARDGLLLRVRVPGGLITAAQLRTLATLAPELEITARANLQLRALAAAQIPAIAQALTAAGLLPSPTHDRVRNLTTSPLAGLDPTELLDTRPYLRTLDQSLCADPLFTQLHPKFSLGLDGGGRRFTPEPDDLTLRAITPTLFQLAIAGTPTQTHIAARDAVSALLTATRAIITLAHQLNLPTRTARLPQAPIFNAIAHLQVSTAPAPPAPPIEPIPLGLYTPTTLIPSVPLGRLTAAQAQAIAHLAEHHQADLRLTPWRGILLAALAPAAIPTLTTQLAQIGLPTTPDGFHGLSACAGLEGCDAALADVRQDAHILAATLPPSLTRTVNLSACEKQCARRHAASADLIATPEGYRITLAGHPVPGLFTSAEALRTLQAAS